MSLNSLLNQTCTISRKTETVDTNGASTFSWSSVATGVRCAVQITGPSESNFGQRETGMAYGTVYFVYGQDVLNTDRILPTTGKMAGKVLTVQGSPVDDGGRNTYSRVPVEFKAGGAQR